MLFLPPLFCPPHLENHDLISNNIGPPFSFEREEPAARMPSMDSRSCSDRLATTSCACWAYSVACVMHSTPAMPLVRPDAQLHIAPLRMSELLHPHPKELLMPKMHLASYEFSLPPGCKDIPSLSEQNVVAWRCMKSFRSNWYHKNLHLLNSNDPTPQAEDRLGITSQSEDGVRCLVPHFGSLPGATIGIEQHQEAGGSARRHALNDVVDLRDPASGDGGILVHHPDILPMEGLTRGSMQTGMPMPGHFWSNQPDRC